LDSLLGSLHGPSQPSRTDQHLEPWIVADDCPRRNHRAVAARPWRPSEAGQSLDLRAEPDLLFRLQHALSRRPAAWREDQGIRAIGPCRNLHIDRRHLYPDRLDLPPAALEARRSWPGLVLGRAGHHDPPHVRNPAALAVHGVLPGDGMGRSLLLLRGRPPSFPPGHDSDRRRGRALQPRSHLQPSPRACPLAGSFPGARALPPVRRGRKHVPLLLHAHGGGAVRARFATVAAARGQTTLTLHVPRPAGAGPGWWLTPTRGSGALRAAREQLGAHPGSQSPGPCRLVRAVLVDQPGCDLVGPDLQKRTGLDRKIPPVIVQPLDRQGLAVEPPEFRDLEFGVD